MKATHLAPAQLKNQKICEYNMNSCFKGLQSEQFGFFRERNASSISKKNENSAMPNLGREVGAFKNQHKLLILATTGMSFAHPCARVSSNQNEVLMQKSDEVLLKQNSIYFLKTETEKKVFANDNFLNQSLNQNLKQNFIKRA